MRERGLTAIILCAVLMCFFPIEAAKSKATDYFINQTQPTAGLFSAIVGAAEARFTIPAPTRAQWKWHQPTTKDNTQEYRMDVTVLNQGKEYTFGFYLWKRPGAQPHAGSFSDLLRAGQVSLFERSQSRLMTIIKDAGIKVKLEDDHLVISIRGKKNVERLFSGHPADVTIKINLPNDPPVSTVVPVKY
jgi:hypothetical protein